MLLLNVGRFATIYEHDIVSEPLNKWVDSLADEAVNGSDAIYGIGTSSMDVDRDVDRHLDPNLDPNLDRHLVPNVRSVVGFNSSSVPGGLLCSSTSSASKVEAKRKKETKNKAKKVSPTKKHFTNPIEKIQAITHHKTFQQWLNESKPGPESKLVKNKKRKKSAITYGSANGPPYENKGDKAEVQIKKILKSETKKENSLLLGTLFNLRLTDTVNFPTQSMEKASNKEKADCFMEVERDQSKTRYNMSIKFVGSGDCSIVNQDHRAKSVYSPNWRNCEEGVLFHCLGGIDSLISRLNYERAIGDRSQDIPFINIDFTEVERKAMEALLVHHTFIGAGTGAFQHHVQSNCVLIVGNVQDTNTWVLTHCPTLEDKKKYVQSKWDKYILAIRGKGMQVEQSYRKSEHQLARWVSVWALPRFINRVEQKGYSYPIDGCEYVGNWWEKPKCTLNIRMKK